MKEFELIEKRTPKEKHFLQKDGTVVAKIYATDIHYLKNGKYVEIDNELIEKNGIIFNKENEYKAEFNKDYKESLLKISKNSHYIDFNIINCNEKNLKSTTPSISKQCRNKLIHELSNDISIEYQTLSNKVKETIILNNNNYSEIDFELNSDLILKNEKGEIVASDDDNNIVFKIEKPFMVDSKGIRNDKINYELVNIGKKYLLKLVLDEKWIKNKERVFPIIIDPTIISNQSGLNISDTFIYPGDTNDNRSNLEYLVAGVNKIQNQNRINRTLIKFELPTIGTGSEIVEASLSLIPCVGGNTSEYYDHLISIHRITENWSESSANWNNMNDKFDSKVEEISTTHRSYIDNNELIAYPVESYITGLVKKWYENTPNYGIMIKACNESYINDEYPMFFSTNNTVSGNPKPYLTVKYRDTNGLEDYADYKEQIITDGKLSVNTHTGNLTTSFKLGNTIGGAMPVSLNLIYNTNDVVLENQTFFGKGYKLDLEQTIEKVGQKLKYLDEDGTTHYFNKETDSTNEYIDEDNLDLKIQEYENEVKMIDSDNTEMLFIKRGTKFYLSSIKDIDNNQISINYNVDNSISKVIDNYNNEINLTYGNDLITISSPNLKTVQLNYTNNLLTSIISPNGTIQLLYDSNNLISRVIDITGIGIEYEYYSNSPYKVKKIKELSTDNLLGKTYELSYSLYETSITDNKGAIEIIAYNDYGIVESRSILKNTNKISDAYSIEEKYESNKKTSEMLTNRYINNYLVNTSFEDNQLLFIPESGITIDFDSNNYNSGLRSLKVESTQTNKSIEQDITIQKGKAYTFSGYIKNLVPAKLILSYIDSNNNEISSVEEIDVCSEFERRDVSILYSQDANTDLKIKIQLDDIGLLYLDDIQLEEGYVANHYNLLENSNFKNGTSGWICSATLNGNSVSPSNYIHVINVDDDNNALKIDLQYNLNTTLSKKFNIKGKEGESYTLSFWYNNKATLSYAPNIGSNVSIFYEPYDDENGHCILSKTLPITNGNSWQHFVYSEKSIEDFKSIELVFHNFGSANNIQIANISLYKDVPKEDYEYDENGSLISITNQSDEQSDLNYDSNKQLISITNSQGHRQKYEYDYNKKNRIINTINEDGLVENITYQSGNPIKNKLSKKYISNISSGIYKIRRKGTNKYIKAELNFAMLEESNCSNTLWFFEKIGEKYKIKYNVNRNYSLSFKNGELLLDTTDSDNLFYINKNEDESYEIKYDEITGEGTAVRFLNATENDLLELNTFSECNELKDFYIEIPEEIFVENDISYTDNEKFKNSETDSIFRNTLFEYDDTTGMLTKVTKPNGLITEYTYNNKDQCTTIEQGNRSIDYSYNSSGFISNIIHGNKNYSFNYDNFARICETSMNNNTISRMEYENNNGLINKTLFGNNQYIEYSYDDFDRISQLTKEDDTYNYYYDTNSNISKIVSNNSVARGYYDNNNRLRIYNKEKFNVRYDYDSEDCIINKQFKYKNLVHNQINSFDGDKIISTYLDSIPVYYSYDALNRNNQKNINNIIVINKDFIYNGKRTSSIVNQYQINSDSYKYEYDDQLNVTKILLNNNVIKEFEYDIYNELIKEKDYVSNIEIDYTYDNNGNMTVRTKKDLTTNNTIVTYNYSYNNTNWEDQLTSFDNNMLSYDDLGNLISYKNNTFTWKNGIELASFSNSIDNKYITYKYDDKGVRTSKNVNNTEIKYYYLNDDLVYEDRNGNVIYYLYDVEGLIGFVYENTTYYYLKNLTDDIIGIMNTSGNIIANYVYDSWGKIISITDGNNNDVTNNLNHIANINPFRYRSYYYDIETDLYYLKSRYYSPELERFISPDIFLGTNGDFLSYNLYAYVSNNPISNYDENGYFKLFNKIVAFVGSLFSSKAKKKAKKLSTSKKKRPEKTIDFGIGKIVVGQTANTVISTTPKKLGKTTVTLNSNGPSCDYTLGHYGYTVGPSNVDIFSTSTYKNTTYKSSLGVEDKYYYSRLGIDIKADKALSLDTYGKLYLRQEVVDVALIVIPAFGEITVLAKDGASAIKTAKEIVKQLAKRSILIPVGGSG